MDEPSFSAVAVCIATRNRPQGLARALDSLTRLDPPPLPVRVVVIDNAHTPTCAEAVARVADRLNIEWFHEPRTGIPFARNAALDRLDDTELMACIDDDCAARPEWLVRLLATMGATGADVVGGPTCFVAAPGTPNWVYEVGFAAPHLTEGSSVSYVGTGNSLYSVRALRSRGLRFDERHPLLGGEDSWLSYQLVSGGARLVWSPDAWVDEYLPANRASVRWLARRHFRYGYGASLRRLEEDRLRAVATESARVAYRFAHTLVLLVGGLVTGRRLLLRSLLRASAAFGAVWALVGGRFADYRETDGR